MNQTLRVEDLIDGGAPCAHDRVRGHWGAIFAGAFAGFGAMVLMAVLGSALGVTMGAAALARGVDDPEGGAIAVGVGVIVWALLTAIIVGLVGGLVMSRAARHDDGYRPALFGMVNWATGLTLALLLAASGGGGLLAGALGATGGAVGTAGAKGIGGAIDGGTASARERPASSNDARDVSTARDAANRDARGLDREISSEEARRLAAEAAKAATVLAWTAFAALVLGLLATILGAGRRGAAVTTQIRNPALGTTPA